MGMGMSKEEQAAMLQHEARMQEEQMALLASHTMLGVYDDDRSG